MTDEADKLFKDMFGAPVRYAATRATSGVVVLHRNGEPIVTMRSLDEAQRVVETIDDLLHPRVRDVREAWRVVAAEHGRKPDDIAGVLMAVKGREGHYARAERLRERVALLETVIANAQAALTRTT